MPSLPTTSRVFHIIDQQDNAALQHACQDIDAVFNLSANHIISKSNQSEIFYYTIGKQQYYIKRYFKTVGFASWFGLSRYRIETDNQLWFNQTRLPSATVAAYGEERFLFKTQRAVLITKSVENTRSLAEIAADHADYFNNQQWRDNVIKQSAAMLRFFHENRFCHNDLHWRNILIKDFDSPQQLQIYLIDCPRGRHLFWPFLTYKKFKDLANIDKLAPDYLSRTRRLQFMFTYLGITKLDTHAKQVIRTILKHKSHRIKRKTREKRRAG